MQENKSRSRVARNAGKYKKRSRRVLVLIIAVILLLLAIAGVGLYLYAQQAQQTKFERYQFDTDAMAGRIQAMTEEEIQAELDRVVEEGMFNISIASSIVFESPDGPGEARIENVAANHYHMQVDIALDDTGEIIYSSNLIRPGYSIETIRPIRRLEPGIYRATATFSAITQKEMQLFGQAGAQIILYVMDDDGRVPTPTPTPLATPTPVSAP